VAAPIRNGDCHGCGALVIDEKTLIAKLAAIAAGSAVIGAAIVPIPVLPAAL